MPSFRTIVEHVGIAVDAAGVLVIVIAMLIATGRFFMTLRQSRSGAYRTFRQDLGRGILLGLEFLVAADIIRTVAVAPTLDNVLVLGVIVLIRTFLSMALEVELQGRWPWQQADKPDLSRAGE
ncbi:MAG TPA: DUF1622 domain-containing protein [Tepidisphaeraceae bacterium]|jgi:uncharacterized membrane protein